MKTGSEGNTISTEDMNKGNSLKPTRQDTNSLPYKSDGVLLVSPESTDCMFPASWTGSI